MTLKSVHLGKAECGLDLGVGSERGEYVCQDYILNKLGRPHRCVNLMYTYYPNDEQWPERSSVACKDMEVSFAWDYPYDDYFPFAPDGPQFEQMRDIRRHGQDVMLTLTVDCAIDDSHIYNIARSLSSFGRMRLRINHECNGNWFTHNRRFSFNEIADFFVRFSGIVKEVAPQIQMVFCAGLITGPDETGTAKVECEDEFADAYKAADIWSADKYLALHYGWPYDYAEIGGNSHTFEKVIPTFERFHDTYKRLSSQFGEKPFIQAELNADGDVTGPLHQAEPVMKYYRAVRDNKASWMTGLSMYQFRDRGRLGLEIEDPNNSSVGIEQPILKEYLKVLRDPYFSPSINDGEDISLPATLRWGSSEDSDGISLPLTFDKTPEFCEVTLQEDLALMMEFNGRWFYKAPGVKVIDLMPAFFENTFDSQREINLNIFATPADGENHDDGKNDWNINTYAVMKDAPEFRIRYEVPGVVE